jgi:hypothetical protein
MEHELSRFIGVCVTRELDDRLRALAGSGRGALSRVIRRALVNGLKFETSAAERGGAR